MSITRDPLGITEVRLGPLLRLIVWGQGRGWTLYALGWVFSHPAHPDGFVPFSERYGYRKAYHLLGGCLSQKRN